MLNTLGLIPLRGGSKSIPLKNIKLFAGKPLCYWALSALYQSGVTDKIVISTDSKQIADTVKKFGIPLEIINRPAKLASDSTPTESVMLHAVQQIPCKQIITVQVTSPSTTPDDFKNAFRKFKKEKWDSLLTCVRNKRFFWSDTAKPINYLPSKRPMRQNFRGTLMENGAFYITTSDLLLKKKCRLGGKIGIHEMAEDASIEIDEPEDWTRSENIFLKKYPFLLHNSKIKLLVFDVDVELTDGDIDDSSEGKVMKKFETYDSEGIELAKNRGIEVAILTSENSQSIRKRADKLKVKHLFLGIQNKLEALEELCQKLHFSLDEVCYVGDKINDLECLKKVGLPCCPHNAQESVKKTCKFTSNSSGGHGAVREIVNFILFKNS